jgi:thiamine biosynthesis protein ThiI
MKEIILCKYGEIVLKGTNRPHFEAMLSRELKGRAKRHGGFKVHTAQSTVFIEPNDEFSDIEGMFEACLTVFGIVAAVRACVCEKTPEAIYAAAREYLPEKMEGKKTFRVDAKRSDKRFPLQSPQIAAEVGGALLSRMPKMRVDLHNPDCMIRVEVRDKNAYIHADQQKGAGGMPPRTSGRGLLLLSGGIDSPVAGYMLAKRGIELEGLHFESYPYTSERAREKVFTLADKLCEYTSRLHVHVISLTHIQEVLRDNCEEDYFTLLLRIFMMTLAERCAKQYGCQALITGESLGQVASQTIEAINVTDSVVDMPVFRPLIGMDKEEIVEIARKIDTFETSVLPYEDCCTVFTPRHPKTKPEKEKVMAELQKVDFSSLLDEAYATMYTETRLIFPEYK